MYSLNRVQVLGNVGNDPELKTLGDGGGLVEISVACQEKWKDKSSGEQKEKTEWIRCKAFRKTAELLSQYVRKGDKIYIEGKFTTQKWTDKDGKDRWTTSVLINDFVLLGGKGGRQADRQADSHEPTHVSPDEPTQGKLGAGDFDDDIPF